ncbi:alkaline phosphatase [Geobacter sp. SVR]|uniref:alkaline phosphatase n=1 Tax=Geobacter sp. SVR TaxID=2495594 RepID=UPI00143EFCD2|nr:alkaline phosphatase [Geobacter sp. SVR]BCS53379.1 alkaline phosphatase [Geobacter sp. SVR]GCF85495.1 alkaline phosphatase [Geobacter sp. SVR]
MDTSTSGISRRDLIKLIGAGALAALLPGRSQAALLPSFEPARGQGLIMVVGDGMPLGVTRAMHEIRTGVFGHRDSNLYARLRNPGSSVGLMGTASLSGIVTDSAPASAAWATGVKTTNRLLSVLPDGRPLTTIMELLRERGYGCGLVTTTRVTHATPAAWVSHQMHRDLEDAIALDLLAFRPDVLLGGGAVHFDAAKRSDKRDLFGEFSKAGFEVVRERGALRTADDTRPLMGIFAPSHLAYAVDRHNDASLRERQPSLPEMTAAALARLSSNPQGFILQVEAGRIDHANHSNDAWGAITDTLELDDTLAVIELYLAANPKTLVIVTSDHGNSGWGINGTGVDYNDATAALHSYGSAKASFEVIIKKMKGRGATEIRELVQEYTGRAISPEEAALLVDAISADYAPYPGDFIYQPDATLGRILSHNAPERRVKGVLQPAVRRGNVGFTSCNHTAEEQLVLAYGHRAREMKLEGLVDNTDLFQAMCRYFGISHRNPAMTPEQAAPFLRVSSREEWQRHAKLHIA